jgi:anti-sigma factor RsiW
MSDDRDNMELAADAALSRALELLPRPKSPLRAQLEQKYLPRKRSPLVLGAAIAIAAAFALFMLRPRETEPLVAEAVGDHIRIVQSEHPLDIESGGIHQVKPWFTGKVDFAPDVAFSGDDEFPLKGGVVAYFVDRKAAAFVFGHEKHTISLFVFSADGLKWPPAMSYDLRGFHVMVWKSHDLGHALVSDVDPKELAKLRDRL